MTPSRRKQLGTVLAVVVVLFGAGVAWFFLFGGGYHAELWLGRFDQATWIDNRMEGTHSPRRPMVRSLMRRLKPGMSDRRLRSSLASRTTSKGVGRHTRSVTLAGASTWTTTYSRFCTTATS